MTQHGGTRKGAGRKPFQWPTQLIKVKCTKEELAEILKLTTRERAEAMLRTTATPPPVNGILLGDREAAKRNRILRGSPPTSGVEEKGER